MKDAVAMNVWCVIAPLFYSAYVLHSFAQRSGGWLSRCPWEYRTNARQMIRPLLYSVCLEALLLCSCPMPSLVFALLLCINCEKRVSHPLISWRVAERETSINDRNDDDACYHDAIVMLRYHCCSFSLSHGACKRCSFATQNTSSQSIRR